MVCYTGSQSYNARASEWLDYVPRQRNLPNSTVWFGANQDTASCGIDIIDDRQAEYTERFYVHLGSTHGRVVVRDPDAGHCIEISNDRNDCKFDFSQDN